MWVAQGQAFYEIFFRFDTRSTGLLLGAPLAALLLEQPAWFQAARQRLAHGLWLVLAVPLLMAGLGRHERHALGHDCGEAATAVVLLAVLSGKGMLHEMLSAPRLVMVGKLSYGVYLWHYPVVRYLRADWHWSITKNWR